MSTPASFTKGPWETVKVNPDYALIRNANNGKDHAPGYLAEVRNVGPAWAANINLIAAAPDQNASLTELLAEDVLFAWVNETGIGKIEYQRRSAIIERARAALAKARGETP